MEFKGADIVILQGTQETKQMIFMSKNLTHFNICLGTKVEIFDNLHICGYRVRSRPFSNFTQRIIKK